MEPGLRNRLINALKDNFDILKKCENGMSIAKIVDEEMKKTA